MSENEIKVPADETAVEAKTEANQAPETVSEQAAVEATPTETVSATEATPASSTEASTSGTAAVSTPEEAPVTEEVKEEVPPEEISYHAVEKDEQITAIWEMQGQKHLRTIDPRSSEGQKIFSLFTSEIHDTDTGTTSEATEASA